MNPLTFRSRRGFTLIELLTVIAIIGILAAIIIPVVGKVRKTAKSAQCTSNLRQIGMAITLYSGAERGFLPLAYDGRKGNLPWFKTISPYFSQTKDGWSAEGGNYQFCPAEAVLPDQWGTNYASNPNVMPDGMNDPNRARIPFGAIRQPSRILLVGDSMVKADGYSQDYNAYQHPNISSGGDPEEPLPAPTEGTAAFSFRHGGGRMNAVFADGHVQSLAVGELKRRHVRID